MQKVEAYRASDGTLFETQEECQEHEVALTWRARIDDFIESGLCPYTKGTAHANMALRLVVAWELFKERAPEPIVAPSADGVSPIDAAIEHRRGRPRRT